jgi:hypothetical protein
VFHHEPIWQWQDLLQQHRDLHEALAWISLPLARTVAALDRFPTVYAAGSTPLRALLEPVARTP